MTNHPSALKAELLLIQNRPAEAEAEIRQALASNPQDAALHGLLGLALANQGPTKIQSALNAVQTSIQLNPTSPVAYRLLASIQLELGQIEAAFGAIQESLRLDSNHPETYSVLCQLYIQQEDWQKALDSAEAGLRIDPQHITCNNLRALVLVRLGRRAEAGLTLDTALAKDPENSMSHANQGWRYLHQSNPQKAQEHFREALRINPNNQWAQQGIMEAMKARNPIYRVMLAYFLWMSRLKPSSQFTIWIAGYFGYQFLLRGVIRQNESLQFLEVPLIAIYGSFWLMTWIAPELFDLVLRLDKFGRLILPPKRVQASNWIGLLLVAAISSFAIAWVFEGDTRHSFWVVAAELGLLMIPVAGVFKTNDLDLRSQRTSYAIGLACIAALDFAVGMLASPPSVFFVIFAIGILIYTIWANARR